MSGISNDPTLKVVSYALDGLAARQKTIANNVANVDTPGYKAQRVDFESQLQAAIDHNNPRGGIAMETTNAKHMVFAPTGNIDGIKITQQDNVMRNDKNNVDVDAEMTNLAETTLRYQALTQLAGMKISLMKTIARDS